MPRAVVVTGTVDGSGVDEHFAIGFDFKETGVGDFGVADSFELTEVFGAVNGQPFVSAGWIKDGNIQTIGIGFEDADDIQVSHFHRVNMAQNLCLSSQPSSE